MKKHILTAVLSAFLYACSADVPTEPAVKNDGRQPIKVASFNIQNFGNSKRGKEDVMGILERIIINFDIVAVQEIRDISGETVPYFVDRINEGGKDRYSFVISQRLGRTTSKEQYAFIYNTRTITYTGTSFVYNDSEDIFEREPYIAGFRAGNFDFALANIHTKPTDAAREINALTDVVDEALSRIPDDNDVIVLGDYNADCAYFKAEADATPIETDEYFWVIPDSADTTTKATDCTYDRIVFRVQPTQEDYTGKWGVFNFKEAFVINQALAEKVSDHFPVWAEFFVDRDRD